MWAVSMVPWHIPMVGHHVEMGHQEFKALRDLGLRQDMAQKLGMGQGQIIHHLEQAYPQYRIRRTAQQIVIARRRCKMGVHGKVQ